MTPEIKLLPEFLRKVMIPRSFCLFSCPVSKQTSVRSSSSSSPSVSRSWSYKEPLKLWWSIILLLYFTPWLGHLFLGCWGTLLPGGGSVFREPSNNLTVTLRSDETRWNHCGQLKCLNYLTTTLRTCITNNNKRRETVNRRALIFVTHLIISTGQKLRKVIDQGNYTAGRVRH